MTTRDLDGEPARRRPHRSRLTAALAGLAVLGLAGCAAGASAGTEEPETTDESADSRAARVVTVYGEGSVSVQPDVATVQIGARAVRPTAQNALATVNRSANALLDELDALGIPAEDMQTTDLSVYPRYGADSDEITGYEASNSVNVTIRDISTVGEVIDAAASAAGENLSLGGISFSVEDPESMMADAHTEAVEVARARATVLADAAGLQLGDVLSITDGFSQAPVPSYAEAAADSASGLRIEPGSQTLTAQVTVAYELTES